MNDETCTRGRECSSLKNKRRHFDDSSRNGNKYRPNLYVLHTFTVYICVRVCVYTLCMCASVRIDTLWTSRKVFHFIQAVSLEIAFDGTVRGDGPSAARYVCFFQDTFPLTPSRTYTQSRRTIIKKIEGEGSLLIRPANCGAFEPKRDIGSHHF